MPHFLMIDDVKEKKKIKITPPKKGRGCLSYLLGIKKVVLVPLGVFSLKRSTARALAVPFRVLSRKIMTSNTFDH